MSTTYKRGQVEVALWRAMRLERQGPDEPPAVFKTRIKRLLDLDRAEAEGSHAFGAPSEGRGFDADYAAFDAFCLALGLDLLDFGFKQSEIVKVLRHLRPELEDLHPELLARPSLTDRQNHLARHHPHLPQIERKGRAPLADARVFLLIKRVELTEVMDRDIGGPAVLEPVIVCGAEALRDALDRLLPHHSRSMLVIELTKTAQAVAEMLTDAPRPGRGRPKRV